MAPQRRSRRGRLRYWARGNGRRQAQDSIAGDLTRKVLDSYCPYCATDIRSCGPRRILRCPNTALCGKLLPIGEDTCPKCTHYTRPGDNFCRVCRFSLNNVVRGRGGLYQQLVRVPSPSRNPSPARQEIQPGQQDGEMNSDNASDDASDSDNDEPVHNPPHGLGAGFLRIAVIDDE